MAKSILFADDTTIYISSKNKLSLNLAKTNYMMFTNANIEQRNMKLTKPNTTITQTKCLTFLGVLPEEMLKWDEHIQIAKQKINRSFFAINQANTKLCHKPSFYKENI